MTGDTQTTQENPPSTKPLAAEDNPLAALEARVADLETIVHSIARGTDAKTAETVVQPWYEEIGARIKADFKAAEAAVEKAL